MTSLPDHFLRCRAARRLLTTMTAMAFLTFATADGWPASPFELEIGELDRKAETANSGKVKPANRAKKPRRRAPADPGRPSARDLEGEFVSYTIRPGDHIFKVLTTRFGLSSARAEELIPRILRVNGIRDIRGLQVGRTIRIPSPGTPPRTAPKPTPVSPIPSMPEGNQPANTAPPATRPPQEHAPAPIPAAEIQPKPAEGPVRSVPTTSSPSPEVPTVVVRVIPAGDSKLTADAILDALSLKWSSNHPVTIPLGRSGGASLTVPVDRYIEERGKGLFLDFGLGDPDRVTLLRLVELAGYRRIAVHGKDDFRTIAGRILEALELRPDYRNHLLSPVSGTSGGVEVTGYLVTRPDGTGGRVLLTDSPLEKPLLDLIGGGRWDIR